MSPRRRTYILWAAIWLLGSAFMAAQVGFWDDVSEVELEDVNTFEAWSDFISTNHLMPAENTWQYPPGAGFLMLIPRLGGNFGQSFVVTMLVLYLVGTVLIAVLANRERNDVGVWVWLLAMPLLFARPVLRFDLAPTVFGIAALVVIHRRPAWFGALAGIGAMIKAWPIAVLFGEWDRRRLLIALGAAGAAAVLIFGVAGLAFGDQTGFLEHQDARGLQVEAVAASPWYVRLIVTGESPSVAQRFGTNEIASGPADTVSGMLKWISLAVLLGAAVWWLARSRAIRGGRVDLTTAAVSRDFVFAVVLGLVVTSRVLSPQFMIWLIGLAAVVLTAGTTRLARPAWIVIGAVLLTAGLPDIGTMLEHTQTIDPSHASANLVLRNLVLLFAAIDAGLALVALLRNPQPETGDGFSKTKRLLRPS